MSPAEVISEALHRLGPNGEYWIKQSLHEVGSDGHDKYCMIGALEAASEGKSGYDWSYGDNPGFWGANMVVRNQLEAQGYVQSIAVFNNTSEFPQIKAFMCIAVKEALKQEQEQINGQESTT